MSSIFASQIPASQISAWQDALRQCEDLQLRLLNMLDTAKNQLDNSQQEQDLADEEAYNISSMAKVRESELETAREQQALLQTEEAEKRAIAEQAAALAKDVLSASQKHEEESGILDPTLQDAIRSLSSVSDNAQTELMLKQDELEKQNKEQQRLELETQSALLLALTAQTRKKIYKYRATDAVNRISILEQIQSLQESRHRILERQLSLAQYRAELDQLVTRRQLQDEHLSALEEEKAQLAQGLEELRTQIEQASAQLQPYYDMIIQHQQLADSLLREKRLADADLEAAQDELQAAQQELAKAKQAEEELQLSQQREMEQLHSMQQRQLSQLENALQEAQQHSRDTRTIYESNQAALYSARNKLERHERELSEQQAALDKARGAVEETRRMLDNAQLAQRNTSGNTKQLLSTAFGALNAALDKAQAQYEESSQIFHQTQQNILLTRQQILNLEAEISANSTACIDCDSVVAEVNRRIDEQRASFEEQLRAIQQRAEAENDVRRMATMQVDRRRAECERICQSRKAVVDNLNSRLAAEEKARKEAEQLRNNAQTRIDAMTMQLENDTYHHTSVMDNKFLAAWEQQEQQNLQIHSKQEDIIRLIAQLNDTLQQEKSGSAQLDKLIKDKLQAINDMRSQLSVHNADMEELATHMQDSLGAYDLYEPMLENAVLSAQEAQNAVNEVSALLEEHQIQEIDYSYADLPGETVAINENLLKLPIPLLPEGSELEQRWQQEIHRFQQLQEGQFPLQAEPAANSSQPVPEDEELEAQIEQAVHSIDAVVQPVQAPQPLPAKPEETAAAEPVSADELAFSDGPSLNELMFLADNLDFIEDLADQELLEEEDLHPQIAESAEVFDAQDTARDIATMAPLLPDAKDYLHITHDGNYSMEAEELSPEDLSAAAFADGPSLNELMFLADTLDYVEWSDSVQEEAERAEAEQAELEQSESEEEEEAIAEIEVGVDSSELIQQEYDLASFFTAAQDSEAEEEEETKAAEEAANEEQPAESAAVQDSEAQAASQATPAEEQTEESSADTAQEEEEAAQATAETAATSFTAASAAMPAMDNEMLAAMMPPGMGLPEPEEADLSKMKLSPNEHANHVAEMLLELEEHPEYAEQALANAADISEEESNAAIFTDGPSLNELLAMVEGMDLPESEEETEEAAEEEQAEQPSELNTEAAVAAGRAVFGEDDAVIAAARALLENELTAVTPPEADTEDRQEEAEEEDELSSLLKKLEETESKLASVHQLENAEEAMKQPATEQAAAASNPLPLPDLAALQEEEALDSQIDLSALGTEDEQQLLIKLLSGEEEEPAELTDLLEDEPIYDLEASLYTKAAGMSRQQQEELGLQLEVPVDDPNRLHDLEEEARRESLRIAQEEAEAQRQAEKEAARQAEEEAKRLEDIAARLTESMNQQPEAQPSIEPQNEPDTTLLDEDEEEDEDMESSLRNLILSDFRKEQDK